MRGFRSLVAAALALAGGIALAQDRGPLVPAIAAPGDRSTAAVAPPTPGSGTLTKADADAWLDGYLPNALRGGDIAGAVVTVVKDGQILTARGYGHADVATRRPVDPDRTLFRPGSVSKLFTWTAAMQMVDQGKLDLDRDINEYLDFRIPPRDGKPITLRQLMQHTAGFEEAAKGLIVFDPKQIVPVGEYVKRYIPRRIFAPGTTPAYSNYGTHLTAYLVERASGMNFDDYLDRNIFAPLGMRHSTFRQPLPANLRAQVATGYPRASGTPLAFEIVGAGGAGALSSTGTDMGRFLLAHLNGGQLGGNRILSPQAAATMHNSPLTVIPPLNRMELGFFETNANGRQVIGHLGDTLGFHTSLHLFMREGVGFYVSFNSGGKEGAAGTLRNALFHDFADRYFPGEPRDGRVDPKTAAEHARMMTGHWVNSRRFDSSFLKITTLLDQPTISVDEKGEMVVSNMKRPGGAARRWVEIAPFVWRDRDGEDRLAATVVDGKVVRWSMDMLSPFMMFERMPGALSSGWLMPALYAALAVLALTFLYWPVTWFLRRRYKSTLAVTDQARRAYRATRVMAGAVLAVLIGWILVISVMLGETADLSSAFDPWLWLVQVLGAIVFVGAVLVTGWNAWLTWRDGRSWARKLWNTLVFLAALVVLYVAYGFGLLSMTVNY